MTAYPGDVLLYRNRVFQLDSHPLENWFRLVGERPVLRRSRQRPGRDADYGASWALDEDGWLRLVGLAGNWPDGNPLVLAHLFPFADTSVVAGWFSGRLHGMRLGDPHGVDARYGDLRLEVQAGRLVGLDVEVESGAASTLCDSPYWAASLV